MGSGEVAVSACVFCEIVAGRAPAKFVIDGLNTIAIEPLNPVVPGHVIFIPRVHVRDAYEDPRVTGQVYTDAARWLRVVGPPSANLITSIGVPATQSVFHLHVHAVPRVAGDGLLLPWSGQVRS